LKVMTLFKGVAVVVKAKPGSQEGMPARESIRCSNPCFFIVGVPGSGMKYLGQILDSQPDLAVAPDVDWVLETFETRTGLNLEGLLAPELVCKWIEQKQFDPFGLSRESIQELIASKELVPYRRFLTCLFNRYGEARGKQLVGSKTPRYLPNLLDLYALWP